MGLSIAHGLNGHRVLYKLLCKDTYSKWSVNTFFAIVHNGTELWLA